MGHFFSRAIKRLTFGGGGGGANSSSSSSSSKSASRNQLPENEQQEPHGQSSTSQRESDLNRPTVQAIPVGQSIDSAEYAAFENASSSPLPKADHELANKQKIAATIQEEEEEEAAVLDGTQHEDDKENNTSNEEAADQSTQPLVEEAVIKIQALVRGHLTRKALKDAQQQAASPAPNALGQRQFDEESLIKNPPSAIFLPTSPLSSNSPTQEAFNSNSNSSGSLQQQQQQQQQLNKHHANPRVPPLESIAEDEVDENTATTNLNREASAISEEGQRRRLSSARKQSASGNADASQSSIDANTPSSPQPPSTANVSIDIHCDTPASSVSIDIVDHTSVGPLGFGLASVLHPQHSMTVSEHQPSQETSEVAGNMATNDGELQRVGDDEVNILPDISGIPSSRVSAVTAFENNSAAAAAALETASSLPASPPHINLAAAATNSHSIDSAEAAAIRIQSAFRGYHTRKHSPYRRRRSPVANSSSMPQTNGYSDHHAQMMNGGGDRARRNMLLRQQDATAMEEEEEDELDGEEDEGVEGGRLMAEDLANTVLADEDEEDENQRLAARGELESDDIERRDPSGSRVSVDHDDMSPQIGNIDSFEHEQPALVSSSSLEDDQQPHQEQDGQNNARLEVVSPDEAIGSGRSSPALASDNSSGDDEEHGGESPQLLDDSGQQQQQQQPSGSGGKSKKRNRNKRKGKK